MTQPFRSFVWRWLTRLGNATHLAITTGLIFALAYALGYRLLTEPISGNDSYLHLGYAYWLDAYFPHVPQWYPLQGGGESLLHGYPILAHLAVVLLHRLSGLSILQSFRLVFFLSLPLTALGIYFFCWSALKRQTIGLIAAILYLLAPLTWTWVADWGFLGQATAMIFLPIGLMGFERLFSGTLKGNASRQQSAWFALTVVSSVLCLFTHLIVGAGLLSAMILFSLASALTAPRGLRQPTFKAGLSAAGGIILLVSLLVAFYAVPFYFYGQAANRDGLNLPPLDQLNHLPPLEFFGLRPINPDLALTRMAQPLITTVLMALGLVLAARYSRRVLALALVVMIAAVYSLTPEISFALRSISSSLSVFLGLRSMITVTMILGPVLAAFGAWALAWVVFSPTTILSGTFPDTAESSLSMSLRSILASGLALIFAASGIVVLGVRFPAQIYHVSYGPRPYGFDVRDFWERRDDDPCELRTEEAVEKSPLCDVPIFRTTLNIEEFGQACHQAEVKGFTRPSLCWNLPPTEAAVTEFLQQCQAVTDFSGTWSPCRARLDPLTDQLRPENWPAFALSDQDPLLAQSQRLADILPGATVPRIDVSPYLGRLAQDITLLAHASQINSYTFQIALIHAMWGYQQNVFYSHEASSEYGTAQRLNELAQWFGTQYVFLNPEQDPVETYHAAGWQPDFQEAEIEIWQQPNQPDYAFLDAKDIPNRESYKAKGWRPIVGSGPVELWRYPGDLTLATLTTRPAVLIIGKQKTDTYMTFFRLANDGVLPYSQALIVEGRPEVDQYTLDELKPFAALVLYGYDYRNSQKAWDLLAAYVQQGGSLFVDTGWQFQVPEWEFAQAPEVLPVERLTWTDYGMTADYHVSAPEIVGKINSNLLPPLIWEGQPWSVSGAQPSDVRPWGQVVLSAADRPLVIAGEYGTGRVIWSGMNLIAHATSGGQNAEELRFLSGLLNWLVKEKAGADLTSPVVMRNDPDRVDFSFKAAPGQTTWLYWREAYYPNWHAYLTNEQGRRALPIYRGGPGFMLMPIQTTSPTVAVRLAWEASPIEQAALVLSLLGVFGFLALMVDGLLFSGRGLAAIKQTIVARRRPKPTPPKVVGPQWFEPPMLE